MKKIFAILAITVTMIALFAISTNAAMVYSEDFSTIPESGSLDDVPGWRPYDSPSKDYAVLEDGAVKMIRGAQDTIWVLDFVTEDSDNIVKFDAKINAGFTQGPWMYYTGKSGYRIGTVYPTVPEADTWYTFIFQTKTTPDGLMGYIYRKPAGTDEQFVRINSVKFVEKAGSPNMNFGIHKTGMEFWVDNFEIHTGTYVSEITYEADGTEVSALSEIPEGAAELKVSADVFNSDMVSAEMYETTLDVLPVALAFDENGMMLDCQMTTSTMEAFENSYEVTLSIGEYAEKISKIEFYMWDSIDAMNPVFKPIILQ